MTDLDASRRSLKGPVFLTSCALLAIAALAILPGWAGPPPEEGLPDLAKFIGRFHPVMLHLPIGMLVLVVALEVGRVFTRNKSGLSTQIAMFFAAASAVVAVLLGFVLYYSMPGDYSRELAERHLNGGIIFACGTLAAFIAKVWVDVAGGRGAWLYLTLLLGSSGVMGFTSHDGASLTHGEDYLTKYAPDPVRQMIGLPVKEGAEEKDTAPPVKPLGEQVVYREMIVPILEQKCYSCHNADKQKGKYRMDEYELLVKGGKEGDGIVHGKADESNVIVRIDLPEDDDEHMPPEGKRDLEAHEVVLVKWWIDQGASQDAQFDELKPTDAIKEAVAKMVPPEVLARQKSAAEDALKQAAKQRESVKVEVERLRKEYPAALNFESQTSSGVTFTAVSMRKDFGDDDLAKLQSVVPALVSLDLSASTVTDEGAKLLAPAGELRTLRLSETALSDVGLETLAKLPNLESLNLYGTKVTNQGVLKLAALPKLRKLYLWQTQVDEAGIKALKEKLPACEIVTGQ